MGYAVGTKRIRWQSTYLALSTGSLLLFVAVALILLPHTARVAVMGYVAGTIAIGAVSFGVIAKDVRSLPYAPVSFVAFLLFAVRAGLGNLITQINYRGDLYVVALLTAPALLGQYTVAVSAADALYVVTQIPAIVTSPHVGSLDRDGAARITARCVRATLVTSLAIALFCFLVVPYAVRFLYGAAYMPAVAPLRVLLISTVVVSLGTPIANFFTLKLGKPEITLISTSCAACVCIAASFLMIPHFGLIGAAAATTAAYILGQGIWIWLFMRSTRIPLADLFVPTGGDVRTLAQLSRALIQERLLGHRAA
jgi:O-antigen/teichoic acid export membrane protein